MFHVDTQDPITAEAGVRARAAREPPVHCPHTRRRFRQFVRAWIRKNLTRLSQDTNLDFEYWLSKTGYSEARKAELRALYLEYPTLDSFGKKARWNKCFSKDEVYDKPKHSREIYARHDMCKIFFGPTFKAIEDELYKIHHFIKHVPVKDRAKVIYDRLYCPGADYYATDHESFESVFTRELMEDCEFELYDYMTQMLPNHIEFMKEVHETLGGENVCTFKHFVVKIVATRMSGEMCTSLGNGFSNLMFMLFTAEEKGCTNVDGFVEGDDGIFRCNGEIPTKEDFEKLGLRIKLDRYTRISDASFCGLVFDEQDLLVVTDPRKVLASFGWTTNNYSRSKKSKLQALLRCKGLSYAYQYPGCPIISSLANYALKQTRSYDVRKIIDTNKSLDSYRREELIKALEYCGKGKWDDIFVPPGEGTRALVAERYGIPKDLQLRIEEYLDGLSGTEELDLSFCEDIFPDSWFDYRANYGVLADFKDPDLEYPLKVWDKYSGFVREW